MMRYYKNNKKHWTKAVIQKKLSRTTYLCNLNGKIRKRHINQLIRTNLCDENSSKNLVDPIVDKTAKYERRRRGRNIENHHDQALNTTTLQTTTTQNDRQASSNNDEQTINNDHHNNDKQTEQPINNDTHTSKRPKREIRNPIILKDFVVEIN